VTIVLPGDYSKPHPALVIQSDRFGEHPSVTLLRITSELRETPLFRVSVEPTADTGLTKPSPVMVDQVHTVARHTAGRVIGRLDDTTSQAVNRALAVFLGLA